MRYQSVLPLLPTMYYVAHPLNDVQIAKTPFSPAHYAITALIGQQWHVFDFCLDVT